MTESTRTFHFMVYKSAGTNNVYGVPVEMRYLGPFNEYQDFIAQHPVQTPGQGSFDRTKFEVVVYDSNMTPKGMFRTDDLQQFSTYPIITIFKGV